MKEKEEARHDYEQAKSEGKKRFPFEQQRPNIFTMDVANVMPGDIIRIELHYTEMINSTDGIYQFVLPTVVGPRFTSLPVLKPQKEHGLPALF
ncbi:MAG: VIT domain-containing protein [Eisenbergiella sp.]